MAGKKKTDDRPKKPKGLRDWRAIVSAKFLGGLSEDRKRECAESLGVKVEELGLPLPKGYLTYAPLLLFPSGSLPISPQSLLNLLTPDETSTLWTLTLDEISRKSGMRLTHVAVNAGIPLIDRAGATPSSSSTIPDENVIRTPSRLREIHGDFGPAREVATFDEAVWVETRQNGLWQVWAPRYTMFSRGNVTEKARLLEFHKDRVDVDLKTVKGMVAVDMYAGIGYFVFSYAAVGMRVFGWELNPWSVEGLRRGAERNGWTVKVVSGDDLTLEMKELTKGGEQITVFVEDNCHALRRIEELRRLGEDIPVIHVNGGLLPTSEPSWKDSVFLTIGSPTSWIHVHENVGIADIEKHGETIVTKMNTWLSSPRMRTASLENIMRVKTFAPDVWHIVYDIKITSI